MSPDPPPTLRRPLRPRKSDLLSSLLGAGERERVRLQPYLTERMLQQSQALAGIGAVAAQLRERLDGSGYPRGLSGGALGRGAAVRLA